ncbi:MAG: chromosome segregation protein SMC, partial [Clostridia bacterium]|nr:chromosome segregation protein SMC [Clostridia bacterium]
MMRLKGLELQGFKSFADKTVFEFQDGITGVVGPNGSGKSNIADAIRWVMGEQSAKSLRGNNMQDVIFSGTQKRKPLGFAEVSLIIDNTDKKLPIDYDEVVVTRRVFRSGESEYYINKSSVRLKDIHELFMDTGVGRDGYSIIGQGKISEIINTKSDDRRTMFEEAAGITKFRYRKEEAERKLLRTNENVLRVNDIITEIEGQVGPLKQQSEKAKKFLNLRDKLKILEVNVSLKNIEKFRETIDRVEKQASELSLQLDDINNKIELNEKETEEIFAGIADAEKEAEENRDKQQNSISRLSEYKSDIVVLKSKIDGNNDNIHRIELEIAELNSKFDEIEKSVDFEREEYNKLSVAREELNEKIKKLEDEISGFDKLSFEETKDIDLANTEIIEKMNEAADLRSKISNYKALILNFNDRTETIKNELSDKKENYDSLVNNVGNLQNKCKLIKNQNDEIKYDLESKKEEYIKLSEKSKEVSDSLQKTREEYHSLTSRHKILVDMERSYDHYSRSVKAVLNENASGSLKSISIFGTVASLMEVPAKYSLAMDVALGGAAQYIVVQDENDAKSSIEFLKKSNQGRATFLPLSAAKNVSFADKDIESCKGYIGIASQLAKYDKKFKNVIDTFLGRVIIVDNIDNAVNIEKKYSYKVKIVTLTGELLAPGGLMSGGSRNRNAGV